MVGNDASGAVDPQDYVRYFAQPIGQAAYFGLHAYGKPGAGSLRPGADDLRPGSQYQDFELRNTTIPGLLGAFNAQPEGQQPV